MSTLQKGNTSVSISAVDLFCGVGGLTHGLQQAGITVHAGLDVDATCRYAFEKNNQAQFIEKDIRTFEGRELSALYPLGDIKLLVGCAPCQPFSVHTRKYRKDRDRPRDAKWELLNDFGRLIEEVKPDIVAFENVTPLRKEDIFADFVGKLESLKYSVDQKLVYCPDYGVPQKRRRLVLLASALGEISLLPKTHLRDASHCTGETSRLPAVAVLPLLAGQMQQDDGQNALKSCPTVRETIGNLPPIAAGDVSPADPLHRARKFKAKNQARIKQSKPGGTWKDWEEHLRAPCHRKPSGATYTSVYGRMVWDEPAPTITTQFHNFGSGRFGHPEQDRALSIREGAMLQTFPENYVFLEPNEPVKITRLGIHIGNAVPVRLASVIGESIQKHVEENSHG